MKKKLFCLLSACIFMLSGCNLNEDFSDKYVYTTFYPIESMQLMYFMALKVKYRVFIQTMQLRIME